MIARDHGDHDLSLDAVARDIYTSRRQLQRAFNEAGTSFRDAVFATRMRAAAGMLVDESLPVNVVASRVGYRQHAQFAKAFNRAYGLAPSAWRRGRERTPAAA